MFERSKKKKKRNRIINMILLLFLIAILLLLDGRFGLGDLLGNQPSEEAPVSESTEPIDSSDMERHVLRVSEGLIYLDENLIALISLSDALLSLPEGSILILVDDMANNSVFESVEKILKDDQIAYTIEE